MYLLGFAPINAQLMLAQNPQIRKLVAAYPQQLASAKDNAIVWKDGTSMAFEDGKTPSSYLRLLDDADLRDQMNTPYIIGKKYAIPQQNEDPGRVRNEAFFKKMYGSTSAEVQQHLTTIDWFGTQLKVTTVNGVDAKLKAVAAQLSARPELKKYLVKPGGSFLWRIISRTKRLSMHSFGIAIDINTAYSDYWQWAGKNTAEGSAGIKYKNRMPLEIVEIFERHGFIWGGKWYHYDTMHFEYRPELL